MFLYLFFIKHSTDIMLFPGERTLQLDSFVKRAITSLLVFKEMRRKLEHKCHIRIAVVMRVIQTVEQCAALLCLVKLCGNASWFCFTKAEGRALAVAENPEDCTDRRIRHGDTSDSPEV